ncbi:MAG: thiamine-phosphate kinase, partial [Planctomycetia bacterium]|nr:thiamine-phosphate kinase [Planctomycetia bacterium]
SRGGIGAGSGVGDNVMTEEMESAFLSELAAASRQRPVHPAVRLGIGDDAAVLRTLRGESVVTVDMLMDGTDFHADQLSPQRIGRKSLAVNLSDLAAMAARPIAAFVAVALPKSGIPYHRERHTPIPVAQLAREIMAGMESLAKPFHVAIAGGDTNTWNAPLAISVTLIGESTSRGVWRRDGGRPGDVLFVTGAFGGSILSHHHGFTPRVKTALWLNERYQIHAAIDVSDGLSLDLSRMAVASGVGVELDATKIPIAPDAYRLAETDGRTPLDHALCDGEDFELVLAVPPDEAERIPVEVPRDHEISDQGEIGRKSENQEVGSRTEVAGSVGPGVPLTAIGRMVPYPGLWIRDGDVPPRPLVPGGWLH